MKPFLLVLFICAIQFFAFGQQQNVYRAKVVGKDTVLLIELQTVVVFQHRTVKTAKEQKRYNRLVYNVRKVYPYAKLAGEKMRQYDVLLRDAKNESQRRRLMKKAEDELRAEFEMKLRNFTFSQGRILIKLIDRETKFNTYALLSDLRGTVSAVLWQGVGRMFGYNLKAEYDPNGEDREIEEIVKLIEMGVL